MQFPRGRIAGFGDEEAFTGLTVGLSNVASVFYIAGVLTFLFQHIPFQTWISVKY